MTAFRAASCVSPANSPLLKLGNACVSSNVPVHIVMAAMFVSPGSSLINCLHMARKRGGQWMDGFHFSASRSLRKTSTVSRLNRNR